MNFQDMWTLQNLAESCISFNTDPKKRSFPVQKVFILLQKKLQKRDFFGTLGILYVYDWAKYVYCLQICLTQPFRTINLKFNFVASFFY